MKHIILALSLLATSISAPAQEHVRRIGTPTPCQRHVNAMSTPSPDTTLSILFNYQQSPSELLYLAGSYQQKAVVAPIVGTLVGGGLFALGYLNMNSSGADDMTTRAMFGGGAAVAIVSAILTIVYQYKAGSRLREAGEALSAIRISSGGISYHF